MAECFAEMLIARVRDACKLYEAKIGAQQYRVEMAHYGMRKTARIAAKFRKVARCDAQRVVDMPDDDSIICYIGMQLAYGCEKCSAITHVISAHGYTIADLLRDPQCELISAILREQVHACRVAGCTGATMQKICPSVLRAERDMIELRKQQKIDLKTSNIYKCKKCNMSQTLVREMQTRSSDEAPTLAIQCTNCGHCWTQCS